MRLCWQRRRGCAIEASAMSFEDTMGVPPRRRAPLVIGLLAFLAGLVLAGWVLARSDTARAWLLGAPQPVPTAPEVLASPPDPAPDTLPVARSGAALDPSMAAALDERVVEIEGRIDRVGERANAAGANAARAEGLLIAFAARRAIDRGLGYIEGQLRERFGAAQPQAVATVIAAARAPVTLDDLQLGLDDLAPTLTSGLGESGWWASLRDELASLFIVRRAGTPSPVPAERLRHAKRLLEAGQVDKALVEVARLPGQAKAQGWMAQARRYILTRRALDVLETAAILTPRAALGPPPLLPEPAPPM